MLLQQPTTHRKELIRRRKGGAPSTSLFHEPNEEESTFKSQNSITSDQKEFSRRANDLLERVHAAALPMKKFNDVFDFQLQLEDAENRELSTHLDPKFDSFHLRTDNYSMNP